MAQADLFHVGWALSLDGLSSQNLCREGREVTVEPLALIDVLDSSLPSAPFRNPSLSDLTQGLFLC